MRKIFKNKIRAFLVLALALAMMMSLAACNNSSSSSTSTQADTSYTSIDIEDDIEFPTEPVVGTYNGNVDATITLSGDSASVDNADGVTIDGSTITITKAGSYLFTGTLDDGQIVVDTADESKVEIILNGAKITNDDNAAIYVVSSPKKTHIISATDSVNIVEDGET
nr:carbohydrate-binding domain-containing protein [Parasporobacterium sp.]